MTADIICALLHVRPCTKCFSDVNFKRRDVRNHSPQNFQSPQCVGTLERASEPELRTVDEEVLFEQRLSVQGLPREEQR